MVGSKNQAKKSWLYGRTGLSARHDVKLSLKMNKRLLNRRVRHSAGRFNRGAYKKMAGETAYTHCY